MAEVLNSSTETTEEIPRILIIDDSESIHKDFRKALGSSLKALDDFDAADEMLFGKEPESAAPQRYEIDSALQGEQGCQMIRQAAASGLPYSMAFVDVRMPPGIDGVETIRRIWNDYPELQIVICSAHSDYSWEEIIEILDASDRLLILKKPFERIEVMQMAQTLTHKWKLSQRLSERLESLESRVAKRSEQLENANRKLVQEIEERAAAQKEREQIEAQLLQAQKLEAIGQLSAGIAHEINTPTQYIGDNTRFLKNRFGKLMKVVEEHQQIISQVQDGTDLSQLVEEVASQLSGNKIDRLIRDVPVAIDDTLQGVQRVLEILKAMKVFSHIGPDDKTVADLHKSIESTLTVSRSEWKYIAELVTSFDAEIPLVSYYVGEFNQALLNLVINAAHAIEDAIEDNKCQRGVINVSTRLDGDWVAISVSDTGRGIPEFARDRIFDPFFTTKEVGKGSGQGLAMVYACIVNKHGGKVSFDTEIDSGTTFTMRIPIR